MRAAFARFILSVVVAAALVLPAAAQGLITARPAVLYDGPQKTARAKAILSGGYPVKQISQLQGWRKVTTHNGDSGFLAEEDITRGRRAVVIANRAIIYNAANDASPPVFYARRGVVLDLLGREGGWLKVAHPDGETGYVTAAAVWQN